MKSSVLLPDNKIVNRIERIQRRIAELQVFERHKVYSKTDQILLVLGNVFTMLPLPFPPVPVQSLIHLLLLQGAMSARSIVSTLIWPFVN